MENDRDYRTAFITGVSSGLGLGFTEELIGRGSQVFGVSRRGAPLRDWRLVETWTDLNNPDMEDDVSALLKAATHIDLAILNAGVLGDIAPMTETSVEQLESVMTSNVWSCKRILDLLIQQQKSVDTAILISSGAAIRGNYGWGAYAMSKAALNMLAQLYAHEMPDTRILAVAPGLVDTAMQDHLCGEVDVTRFPSMQGLRDAKGTDSMPGPREAAARILDLLPSWSDIPSGGFVDVRG